MGRAGTNKEQIGRNCMIDYLFESKYPGGTYACLKLSEETQEQLFAFCNEVGITDLVQPEDYHCTLVYSKTPCPDVTNEDFALPCKAMAKGYKVLGVNDKVLVLELYCPNAKRLHELFREKYNASHDYDEYIPHITISSKFNGETPIELPEFEIEFVDSEVSALT